MNATGMIDMRFLIREPADVYHAKAKDFLSAHALNEFRRCPLLYRKKELGLVPERDTNAFVIGRAAHTLILEGRQRYEREYAVGGPINPKTGQPFGSNTKAFAEWAAEQSKPVLSDTHAALVEQMAAAVGGHPLARDLLQGGVAEGVVRCRHREFPCQARIDWVSYNAVIGVVDLKTADDLDGFEFALRALGYVHQLAFYRTLVLDSLDWLERLIWADVCEKRGVESMEDIPYGKSYVFALTQWREVLAGLDALRNERGMNIVLIAHAQIERFANPETDTYDRYSPRLQKQASALVQEWCDEVLFATYKVHTKTVNEGFDRKRVQGIGTGERIVRTTERPAHVAKNRLGLPEEIPLDFRIYAAFVRGEDPLATNVNEPAEQGA